VAAAEDIELGIELRSLVRGTLAFGKRQRVSP
jgi:hypothetical protein